VDRARVDGEAQDLGEHGAHVEEAVVVFGVCPVGDVRPRTPI
jgi:hypothetical protein